jgi:hypothetical protein
MMRRLGLVIGLILAVGSCKPADTSTLSPELTQRFESEGVLHRADNVTFRWTVGAGTRRGQWEDRVASIIVTRQSVYLHKNDKVGIEVTPRSRKDYAVERDGDRIRIRAGTGRNEEVWSFIPPDGDAPTWTKDIRAVMRSADSTAH